MRKGRNEESGRGKRERQMGSRMDVELKWDLFMDIPLLILLLWMLSWVSKLNERE
jgi:hypothetical protein